MSYITVKERYIAVIEDNENITKTKWPLKVDDESVHEYSTFMLQKSHWDGTLDRDYLLRCNSDKNPQTKGDYFVRRARLVNLIAKGRLARYE